MQRFTIHRLHSPLCHVRHLAVRQTKHTRAATADLFSVNSHPDLSAAFIRPARVQILTIVNIIIIIIITMLQKKELVVLAI